MIKHLVWLLFTAFLLMASPLAFGQLKVALVGDENIIGPTLQNTQKVQEKLQALAGTGYEIKSFAVEEATYNKSHDSAFYNHPKYVALKNYRPDYVFLILGTNDSKTTWQKYDAWGLMEEIRFLPSAPRVVVCYPPPAYTNTLGVDDNLLETKIVPGLEEVALKNQVDTLNLRTPFLNATSLFANGVWLNAQGADSLAKVLYAKLSTLSTQKRIIVATIGNSITEGVGISNLNDKYPSKLWDLLGHDNYVVHNLGKSGHTMLRITGDNNSYWGTNFWHYLKTMQPNVVLIKLGTNDTKSTYNNYRSAFLNDALAMVDSLNKWANNPQIFIVRPIPAFGSAFGINNDTLTHTILPLLDSVAQLTTADTIDIYSQWQGKSGLTYDGIHPNAAGADTLANQIYRSLMQKGITPLPTGLRPAKPAAIAPMFNVFPNPVEQTLHIEPMQAGEQVQQMQVFNSKGQLIMHQRQGHINRIDVSKLSKGVYWLRLHTAKQITTVPFIKATTMP